MCRYASSPVRSRCSVTRLRRAFQTVAVASEQISVFPVINDISLKDYQLLLKVAEEVDKK
nr:ParB family protein [Escherichia coli]